jgi:hypothetical protein
MTCLLFLIFSSSRASKCVGIWSAGGSPAPERGSAFHGLRRAPRVRIRERRQLAGSPIKLEK